MRKQKIHNEIALMEGFRLGYQKSFTQVFNLFYHALCFYALKITKDQGAAEDIAGESFVRIWERKELFFEINVLKSYLYTTVRNASLNWIKKNHQIQPLTENVDNIISSAEYDSFKNIVGSEVWSKLSNALEQLSPQGKQIIKMIFFEGKNTRVVARELGVSQSTVKTQKGRSMLKLKKSFNL
jgi:RNA polymerase sigma-70 factor (ECF subfamily)